MSKAWWLRRTSERPSKSLRDRCGSCCARSTTRSPPPSACSGTPRTHNRAIELAQRQLRAARTAKPLASYGHELILYADRLSTTAGNHDLTSVSARIEGTPDAGRFHRDDLTLKIEGPTWRREVRFPRRDERKMRRLAEEIEFAARNARRSAGPLEARLSRRSGT